MDDAIRPPRASTTHATGTSSSSPLAPPRALTCPVATTSSRTQRLGPPTIADRSSTSSASHGSSHDRGKSRDFYTRADWQIRLIRR